MKKFSLIELIVIIAIIGILMTILFPSLSLAREKAKAAVCMSNLKNIYTGVFQYSKDHRGTLPYSMRINQTGNIWWRRQAAMYLNLGFDANDFSTYAAKYPDQLGQGVFFCPSVNNGRTVPHKLGGLG